MLYKSCTYLFLRILNSDDCYAQLFAHVAVETCSSGRVVILTSTSVGNYTSAVSPGDLPECFLHSLTTRSFSAVPVAPVLAQPNLVSGLPAQGVSGFTVSRLIPRSTQ